MKAIKYIVNLLLVITMMTSCSDVVDSIFGGGEIKEGDKVMFTTLVPDASATRSAKDEWKKKVGAYKPVQLDYNIMVEMWKENDVAVTASNTYHPMRYTDEGDIIPGYDGTLQSTSPTEMYWLDNNTRLGFKATSVSSQIIETDQSSQSKWIYQDLLTGHSYLPIWTGDEYTGSGTNPEVIQYRTNKEWYAGNKSVFDAAGIMPDSNEDYKKVPLYMKHERSWITIILHAGEGVAREALQYLTSGENIQMTINSFAEGSTVLEIDQPWSREAFVDYPKDKNGEAQSHVSTTRYDAIVMPHNYATKKDEEKIAMINLSGQKFSFYAGNDSRYLASATDAERAAADSAYNLKAGKHLIIDATLSRESRKILITAWIEDWIEVATQTICDDYGQNGDPIVIKSRKELIDFLKNESLNKQGNVGIIQPTELNLDVQTADAGYPTDWPGTYDLNATLNLAGCVLKTKHQLFNNMSSSANLVNGTVLIGDGARVDCAIANTNNGTIERVSVTTTSELSTANATIAGMVKENHGTIYQCTSTLPVLGSVGYNISGATIKCIGGIAAVSTSPDGSMAVIDGCTVNASVNGTSDVQGGGIVGYVTGRVSNNTFEYGVTVSQDATKFKNIFAEAGNTDVRAYGNGWPTKAENLIGSTSGTNLNVYPEPRFDAVFDCQNELDIIMKNQLNAKGNVCRISKSFSVTSTNGDDDWTHGSVNANDHSAGANNVSFTLDGNGKTITLTGNKNVKTTDGKNLGNGVVTDYTTAPMLFNYILGEIKDLNIYLEQPLVASPSEATNQQSEKVYNAEDAIAPLAYAVYGAEAKLTNVNVKAKTDNITPANNAYVQASTAAGLVVWAFGGATIENCKVNVPVRMWLPSDMGSDAKHYTGGIVGVAAQATISQCTYLVQSENAVSGSDYSTTAKKSPNYYYGGIVGGTSEKEGEKPELAINDCTSWFNAKQPTAESTDKTSKGAIIGYTCYAENNSASNVRNGMKDGNQGNWWPLSADGASYWLTGLNEEKVIGKRNGVTPPYNDNF